MTNKYTSRSLLALLVLTMWAVGASAQTTGRGGVYFGEKSLKNSDWGNLDSQAAWGINLDVKDTSWPVWIATGYMQSKDEQTVITSVSPFATADIEGKTSEFRLGIKKDFMPLTRVRLSMAGGPAYMTAKLQSFAPPHNSDSDSTIGVWGGADLILSLQFISLGVSYFYSHGNVDLLDKSVDAGGSNVAFIIGVGW